MFLFSYNLKRRRFLHVQCHVSTAEWHKQVLVSIVVAHARPMRDEILVVTSQSKMAPEALLQRLGHAASIGMVHAFIIGLNVMFDVAAV